jgi:hypothetical protein
MAVQAKKAAEATRAADLASLIRDIRETGATSLRAIASELGWSLPGGQDNFLKAISELAAGGGLTSEKVTEISKTFDPHFPVEHESLLPRVRP